MPDKPRKKQIFVSKYKQSWTSQYPCINNFYQWTWTSLKKIT